MKSILHPTAASLFVLAGPCVIESEQLCLTIAVRMAETCRKLGITYVFKASFDKANRSSSGSYRGLGMHEGLKVLQKVRSEIGVAVLTDVHESDQPAVVAQAVDILQVPAFLARQTDLLIACAKTGKIVNVKKGQFMAPQEMAQAVQKIQAAGNHQILLTERGTFFGYNRLVNDFTGLAIMREIGCPVVFDVTHSTQQPAALGDQSGGNPQYAPLLAHAAVAAGVDGLFLECHPDPANARSDAATMLPLEAMPKLLAECKAIAELRATWH
jgi:2-dehydro-3-deoxyphosphooctonate aldolase (KDO 8-P synthase)